MDRKIIFRVLDEIMNKYMICQTKTYKTYFMIPDDWSGILQSLFSLIINIVGIFIEPQNNKSLSRSLIGPDRMFINIVVTPLKPGEEEQSIEKTREFFEGFSYRQGLFQSSTSKIEVMSKEIFTAKYYRKNSNGVQLIKKYFLYIEKMEYLITTGLSNISKNDGEPDLTEITKKENIYDSIVQSLFLQAK